jgi:pimeloyl-ACP methyl ester carboxylesterase
VDFSAVRRGSRRWGPFDPDREAGSSGRGGTQAGHADSEPEPEFYDTSWLNDDALRKIFTDKLSVHDGYTVRSLLGNPMLATERLDDRLGKIKVPTLVVWGKQDKLLPMTSGERYVSGIAGAKLVSFEKCGHVPPIEKTEEFVAAVAAFLGGGTAATR